MTPSLLARRIAEAAKAAAGKICTKCDFNGDEDRGPCFDLGLAESIIAAAMAEVVRERDEKINRLSEQLETAIVMGNALLEKANILDDLRAQLTARDAEVERLRTALEEIAKESVSFHSNPFLLYKDFVGFYEDRVLIARTALTQPPAAKEETKP